ncbi:MAG: ATP-dependent Clp protease ATP-binding subunit [Clostridia bacterium]|nr:ATP-dependent Clp protease ATP-binding subunit [Clostridia bacterium]
MLCVRCKKNLAVVYVSKFDQDGKQQNEGYCLSCAKELNLGPVNEMIEKMGIDVEELDSLNSEMNNMVEQMGDMDPEMMEEMAQQLMGGEDLEDEDEEEQGRTMKTPFSMFSQFMGGKNKTEKDGGKSAKKEKKNKDRKFLEMYGTNLTTKARNGEVDRVIGRDAEITRVMQILNRRTKNNPCLIGEPGVGKTAIAEGLAVKIVNGEVPAKLLKYEIYLIDMSAMVAGTQFRGQFEQRLKNLISEVKKLGNIILVIDEVHTLTKAGDADGAMNAGNILKPALSKGEIQIIGATTLEEYRKHIEKDSALERRFQTVMVEEPSVEETIEILKGIKEYYEKYHNVKITDDIIRTAAVLSERYITDRFLPDKAIDVIDEAASKVNLDNTALAEIEKLNIELEKVKKEQTELEGQEESEGYFEKTAELKSRVCKIENEIEALSKGANDIYLTPEDLANVIEGWTKIPVKNITEFESRRLINLEERLHTRLIGQDEAVSSVARAIRRKRAGISIKKRPVSFIFVGPTGVGKTELVKQIAREVFDSEENLIRLDMSEYMEKHSVAKLIGAPPGYVGYDDAGQLTEKVRRKPYSVILLDEIEKAHADIFNILLQILDDGRITDSRGKVVSFENTIIVMTSNAGSEIGNSVAGFGYTDNSANDIKVDRALKQLFRPEFLNRVDEIIKFRELNKDELKKIAGLMLSDLKAGLDEKAVAMEVEDSAIELILKKAYNVAYGARPMRRYIERNIEDKFATLIIEGELNAGYKMQVSAEKDEIVIKKI